MLINFVFLQMQTLQFYDDYIKMTLTPIRKALEKRTTTNAIPTEG